MSAARSQPVCRLPEFISELYGVKVMRSKWYGMKLAQHLPAVNRKLYCQKETVLSKGISVSLLDSELLTLGDIPRQSI